MNSTYREHLDHIAGEASEAVNCFSEAQSLLADENAKVEARIREHLAEGLIVLVSSSLAHCNATDAVSGERFAIEAFALSSRFLRRCLEELKDDFPETNYTLRYPEGLEPNPVAAEIAPAIDLDDVPF